MNQNISTQDIYLKMLEYGNECFSCGITFKEVKQRLIEDNLYEVGQSEYPLLLLFEMAFIHVHESCTNPDKPAQDCGCDDSYDHLNKCPHYFSRFGCMDFVKLADAIANEKAAQENQSAAATNLEAAKKSLRLGYIAIFVAFISGILQFLDYIKPTDKSETAELQKIAIKQDSLNVLLLSELSIFQHEFDRTHNKDSLLFDFVGKTVSYLNQNKSKDVSQQGTKVDSNKP